MKRIFASFATLGIVFASSLTFAACANQTSESVASPEADDSSMAQMDHSGMNSPTDSGMAQMDHSGMMGMDLGPADENFDLRFIDAMKLHHQGAIAMAEEALEKSNRDEIRQLAQDIISAQETEITQLDEWRQAWYPGTGNEPMMYHAQMNDMMPMTEEMKSTMMMNMDLGAADEEFDLRFMNAMIPHHEGAVAMAEEAVAKSTRPEIKELAQSIIDSQQQEIDQMNQWKQEWYNQ